MLTTILLVTLASAQGGDDAVDPAAVRAVFELRCTECHGADLPRPKGRFGYVADLARVAASEELVVPGKPEESELFLLITDPDPDFRMPPADAKNGPLSSIETDLVRRWISEGAKAWAPDAAGDGASGEEPAPDDTGPDGAPSAGGEPDDTEPGDTEPGDTEPGEAGEPAGSPPAELARDPLLMAGRFHVMVVHFPIALIVVALLGELLAMVTRAKALDAAVRFCVFVGALAAAASAGLGWLLAEYGRYQGEDVTYHRWLGVATAALALVTAILAVRWIRKAPEGRWAFRFSLLLTALTVGVTGHFGGILVYGRDWLPLDLPLPF